MRAYRVRDARGFVRGFRGSRETATAYCNELDAELRENGTIELLADGARAEYELVEIPTDKPGLLAFLNEELEM